MVSKIVDSFYGGFPNYVYTYNFKPTGTQDKFIVTQARHTWTTAKASRMYPEVMLLSKLFKKWISFFRDVMWDKTYGGFYSLVDRQGNR